MSFQHELKRAKEGTPFEGVARLLFRRNMGSVSFWNILFHEDVVQLMLRRDYTEGYRELRKLPLGSLLYCKGTKCITNTGMHSLLADSVEVLHRFEGTWPDKVKGLADETRYHNRVMDMLVTPGVLQLMRGMSIALQGIRQVLNDHGFLECNTGVLQRTFEAGAAQPFVTKARSTGDDLFLSLTSELKLKRLIAGGLVQVYEVAQSFRNEGIDSMHAPEFTLLEVYGVSWDYKEMMGIVEQMVRKVFERLGDEQTGDPVLKIPDVSTPFAAITFKDAFRSHFGDRECSLAAMIDYDADAFHEGMGQFTWLMKVIEKYLVMDFSGPVFLTELPAGMSPLTKRNEDGTTQRAFFILDGLFVADIYTDETDEQIVLEGLRAQAQAQGTEVNMAFVEILRLGLPPTAGIGLGLNRLYMALTGAALPRHIKETTPFSPF